MINNTNSTLELLTPQEVSKIIRLSTNTIRQYISQNKIPGIVRLGRRTFVRKDILLKWIEECTET